MAQQTEGHRGGTRGAQWCRSRGAEGHNGVWAGHRDVGAKGHRGIQGVLRWTR